MISTSTMRYRIEQKIKKYTDALKELQGNCAHFSAEKTAKSDTGNWCKQDDSYWYECFCPECGKRWVEDQ